LQEEQTGGATIPDCFRQNSSTFKNCNLRLDWLAWRLMYQNKYILEGESGLYLNVSIDRIKSNNTMFLIQEKVKYSTFVPLVTLSKDFGARVEGAKISTPAVESDC